LALFGLEEELQKELDKSVVDWFKVLPPAVGEPRVTVVTVSEDVEDVVHDNTKIVSHLLSIFT
jgi:hypothetical protein